MIIVIGWDGSEPPPAARRRLEAAVLVVGDSRCLAAARPPAGVRQVVTRDPAAALAEIDAVHPPAAPGGRSAGDVVVLAGGDPGFFGIVRALRDRGHEPEVVPAVSSAALAFARAGLPWDDALVVSALGGGLRRAVNACRAHPKVAVLTVPGAGPAELARELAPQTPREFVVCEDLGGPAERVIRCRPADTTTRTWHDPEVVLVLDPARAVGAPRWIAGAAPGPAGWALPGTAFERPGPHVTPAEVRALALARLGPRIGDLVWDIGSGAGAVAVECARFGAAVIAVDRDPASCDRIRVNVRAHHVKVAVSRGEAPGVLDHLPDPDAVFVGGGGVEVVRACAARARRSVVAAFDAAERAAAAMEALAAAGFTADAVLLRAVRPEAGPPRTGPAQAEPDPVLVVWGTRTEERVIGT